MSAKRIKLGAYLFNVAPAFLLLSHIIVELFLPWEIPY